MDKRKTSYAASGTIELEIPALVAIQESLARLELKMEQGLAYARTPSVPMLHTTAVTRHTVDPITAMLAIDLNAPHTLTLPCGRKVVVELPPTVQPGYYNARIADLYESGLKGKIEVPSLKVLRYMQSKGEKLEDILMGKH